LRSDDEDPNAGENDPNRIDYSASQSGDWTCIRRLFRLVKFRSASAVCAVYSLNAQIAAPLVCPKQLSTS
jgi:hypothetical protein